MAGGVPLYPIGGTVGPAPLPGPRESGVSPDQVGAAGAHQLESFGAAGEAFFREQAMLQNQVRVNDAVNQARQKALDLTYDPEFGYMAQKGRGALERTSGQALPDEYGGRLDEAVGKIAADLTPQQRRVFELQSKPILSSFRGDVQRHQLQESHAYALSVQDSTLKLASDQAAQHWDDPRMISGGVADDGTEVPGLIQQAKAAVYATSKLTGLDPSAAMFEAGSRIHARVIDAALVNDNPLYAAKYLQAHSKDMTGDAVLRVQAKLNQAADAQIAMLAVDTAMKKVQPAAAPTEMDRLHGLVAQAESGGRETTPDGSTVTSPKGAKGLMQVMDATAGNPGFGIAPAKRLADGSFDPGDRTRVGRQYLSAMLQKYGNVPMALAAYNAGPKVVDAAIKEAESIGEPASAGTWLQLASIPKETRDYVNGIMAKYEAGGGAAPLPTKLEFVQAAEAQLGPSPRPTTLQLVRTRAEQQYELLTTSRKEDTEQAVRAVQQALLDNGGDMVAVQREKPQLISQVRALDPGRMDDLMRYSKAIGKGDRTDNMEAYGEAWSHPEEMARMSDAKFDQFVRTSFTDATAKELWKRRTEFMEGKIDGGVGAVNDTVLKQAIEERLGNLGLTWTGAKATKDNKAAFGTAAKYLRDGIFDAQHQAGKKFTPEEITDYVDRQFQRGEVEKRWFGVLPDRFKPDLTQSYGDVPAADRASIDTRMPGASEGDKLRVYWQWKGNRSRATDKTASAQ